MPIINGQKMACAPCIRGHRSTKCTHHSERVMVPVRKPGRPLSTCPCPPGRPCGCGGVKVAIPRKQKCGCGSEDTTETNGSEHSHSPTEVAPTSPTRPPFRISKSSSGPRTNSRKQSFDPANLERMDPMSINIVNFNGNSVPIVGNGMTTQVSTPVLSGFGTGTATVVMTGVGTDIGFIPQRPSNGIPHVHDMGFGPPLTYRFDAQYSQAHNQPPQTPSHEIKAEDDNRTAHTTNGLHTNGLRSNGHHTNGLRTPTTPAPVMNGSRSNGVPIAARPQKPADSRPPLLPKTSSTTSGGSCCGGGKQPMAPPQPMYDKSFVPQFQPPVMDMKNQNFSGPAFQYPTFYTYPPEFGSWQHPVNPATWQHMVASQPGMPIEAPSLSTPSLNGHADGLATTHQCVCGPGCQCIGCLAHPFNDQMYQYISNAYSESDTGSNNATPAPAAGCCSSTQAHNPTQGTAPDSPPQAQTPSDASALSEEQALPTGDFVFFEFPIACGGDVVYCPCGDDCQCEGCLVHNSAAIPLQRGDWQDG
ncbi:hypothetical protein QBC46DRAFT_371147 [Diplogelasinospora grovesii]|uniref:Copper-fist domain-containing protein n=1 Tax=Diplogelasinospora grovesii TaxID=303347 RepID=A0AAN6NL43_9PEZI|nr:hypothetical protein QBC46DRAFT_371147 [Diplogelasinospora grovesii]